MLGTLTMSENGAAKEISPHHAGCGIQALHQPILPTWPHQSAYLEAKTQ